MYNRSNMEPHLMTDYILFCDDGNSYIGHYLRGKTYEGWYVKDCINIPKEDLPKIFSQKELKCLAFTKLADFGDEHNEVRRYIPLKLLDEAFQGHQEVHDFEHAPDILCYL